MHPCPLVPIPFIILVIFLKHFFFCLLGSLFYLYHIARSLRLFLVLRGRCLVCALVVSLRFCAFLFTICSLLPLISLSPVSFSRPLFLPILLCSLFTVLSCLFLVVVVVFCLFAPLLPSQNLFAFIFSFSPFFLFFIPPLLSPPDAAPR